MSFLLSGSGKSDVRMSFLLSDSGKSDVRMSFLLSGSGKSDDPREAGVLSVKDESAMAT